MGKNGQFIKDILKVSASNIFKLMSSVLVGLLLPKILGVEDYGYYKTFTLYIHYVGLFHFGIQDGIYLVYGGKDFEELEKTRFRFYSRFFIGLEFVISVLLATVSALSLSGELRFIFLFVAVYLFAYNVTGFYQMISQITGRFTELSRRNLIQSACVSAAVLTLYVLFRFFNFEFTYRLYMVIYTGIIAALGLWYINTYRVIIFGEADTLRSTWREIPRMIRIGFPLTVANLCSTLILSLDRQFVNILFDTETYAVYAFAYNMLALVTSAVSAISTVLYPRLKRTSAESLTSNYTNLTSIIGSLVFCALSIYFPLCIFVDWFLPKYTGSLPIFRIIFPGLAISSSITIVMHNYYKVLGISNKFFVKSVIILGISAAANYLAYTVWGTTVSISVASICVMIFWYFFVESYFIKQFHIQWKKKALYMFIMVAAFYLITCIQNHYLGFFVYLAVYALFTLLFQKDLMLKLLKQRKG